MIGLKVVAEAPVMGTIVPVVWAAVTSAMAVALLEILIRAEFWLRGDGEKYVQMFLL